MSMWMTGVRTGTKCNSYTSTSNAAVEIGMLNRCDIYNHRIVSSHIQGCIPSNYHTDIFIVNSQKPDVIGTLAMWPKSEGQWKFRMSSSEFRMFDKTPQKITDLLRNTLVNIQQH